MRVFWDETELEFLATEVARMRLNYPIEGLVSLINRAQKQLPENRRRKIQTVQTASLLVSKIQLKLAEIKALSERTFPVPPSVDSILQELSIEKLMLVLMNKVSCSVTQLEKKQAEFERLLFNHQTVLDKLLAPISEPVAAGKQEKKKCVVVVGLLGNQMIEVSKSVKDLDLKFVSKEVSKPEFPQADLCILMTSFINHTWDTAAIQKFGRDNIIRQKGGVSGLIATLRGLS